MYPFAIVSSERKTIALIVYFFYLNPVISIWSIILELVIMTDMSKTFKHQVQTDLTSLQASRAGYICLYRKSSAQELFADIGLQIPIRK